MSLPTTFFSLPVELRNIIYDEVLNRARNGEVLDGKWITTGLPVTAIERPRAYISHVTDPAGGWASPNTGLALVNRQVQREALELVGQRRTGCDVVVRVVNMDFREAIALLSPPLLLGRRAFSVPEDGAPARWLRIELAGPYRDGWRANLVRWIECVRATMAHPDELAALHSTIPDDSEWIKRRQMPTRLTEEMASQIYDVYNACERGPARIECYKVLMAVVGRLNLSRTWWKMGMGAIRR